MNLQYSFFYLGIPRMLLRCVCASCLNLFTEDAMENSTACWQWILSARHDLTLPFMQEMIAAWQVRDNAITKTVKPITRKSKVHAVHIRSNWILMRK